MGPPLLRIACETIPYRKGFIEVARTNPGLVNLETWEVSAEWGVPLGDPPSVPDDAIVANTELELTVDQARALASALVRAADEASAGAEPAAIAHVRLDLSKSLPRGTRWLVRDTPLRFDFARVQTPLMRATDEFDTLPPLALDPARLFIFGDQDYADGGGATPALALDEASGAVFALDLESEAHPLRFINSTIDQFVRSFMVLDKAFRVAEPVLDGVVEQLTAIDPAGFQRSEWRELLDHLA